MMELAMVAATAGGPFVALVVKRQRHHRRHLHCANIVKGDRKQRVGRGF